MKSIRTLIVDDEPMARDKLASLLGEEPDIELVGQCGDGAQAVSAIEHLEPDLVFLDVQMPGVDGFGVIQAVGADRMPLVVFVTAYDAYSLKAFEVHALDYLLKPFARGRFQHTLQRARESLDKQRAGELGRRLMALVENLRPEPGAASADRLIVRSGGRVLFVGTEELDWIEAAGNYVRLHFRGESHLYRETMNSMEARLRGGPFLRIHRSWIVNTERIKELQQQSSGDYVVVLRTGTRLALSRRQRDKVQEALSRHPA